MNDLEDPRRTAPTLFSLPKEDPFVAPEGFFERFPHQVQAKLPQHPQGLPVPGIVWRRLVIALPVVALVGLGLWWFMPRGITPAPATFAMDQLPADAALYSDIDESVVLAYIAENNEVITDPGAVDLQLNDQELIAYLETENADIAQLITDLE